MCFIRQSVRKFTGCNNSILALNDGFKFVDSYNLVLVISIYILMYFGIFKVSYLKFSNESETIAIFFFQPLQFQFR